MEGLIFGILRYGGKCSPYSGWSHAIRGELRDSELAFSWETGHRPPNIYPPVITPF